ncbi:4-hydroxyphenylpyruvate dioxygenase-like protein [Saccoglossus kowalevskii]|uniref:4-hydroxyphenylpyruvate dioxygenase-like protein-like n=1 Tax=Saccoglossus kowalevskii TaxID=10224 RepID=A0ABM0MLS0_SACKO|nr:PREDICTED: 4-hydroxyphenylpyruvate dioxygenase-like protein-like [Saccoglossus kowalevskii]
MSASIDHFEVACVNALSRSKAFCTQFGFSLFAVNLDGAVMQYACKAGESIFVFSQRPEDCVLSGDTVFDCALSVDKVAAVFNRALKAGATNIKKPMELHDENGNGSVTMAIIGSPIGNVVHTLINRENYKGIFLPGFTPPDITTLAQFPASTYKIKTTHIDHVTYVVERGTSPKMIEFYGNALGCERFRVNLNEDDETGMPVNVGSVEMRLMAAEYWRCAESGVRIHNLDSDKQSVTFVMVEAIWGKETGSGNQIATYLENHGGPGIQHIALHTNNIVESTRAMRQAGCVFPHIPQGYYTKIGKSDEIERVGECLEELKKLGILLDAEGEFSYDGEIKTKDRYLMQAFTAPIFQKNTFFMEVISRFGACGFGAGNITALWDAMEAVHQERTSTNSS